MPAHQQSYRQANTKKQGSYGVDASCQRDGFRRVGYARKRKHNKRHYHVDQSAIEQPADYRPTHQDENFSAGRGIDRRPGESDRVMDGNAESNRRYSCAEGLHPDQAASDVLEDHVGRDTADEIEDYVFGDVERAGD